MIHLVRLLTQTWVRLQGRKSEPMLIWKSAPSKFSRVPSWKSIEHLTLQTRLSIAHRKTHYKPSVEPEAVTIAAELQSIKDKRFYTEVYENDTNEKVISGKWVLKSRKARYVLRGFEEDVNDEDVFASTIMTASVRMLLSLATVPRSEGRTVFTADVKTAFFNAHMKDGDVVYARPPPERQPETLDPSKGTVIWKLQKICVV